LSAARKFHGVRNKSFSPLQEFGFAALEVTMSIVVFERWNVIEECKKDDPDSVGMVIPFIISQGGHVRSTGRVERALQDGHIVYILTEDYRGLERLRTRWWTNQDVHFICADRRVDFYSRKESVERELLKELGAWSKDVVTTSDFHRALDQQGILHQKTFDVQCAA
jgi:hypothetical protein